MNVFYTSEIIPYLWIMFLLHWVAAIHSYCTTLTAIPVVLFKCVAVVGRKVFVWGWGWEVGASVKDILNCVCSLACY